MVAYYNEINPFAAQWLRNLIAAGHIAPGEVDERSILDVKPDDIKHFTQCHFFAGIGVWSHALRKAGWPDDKDKRVWTGSCPCQPFSLAGNGGGFSDERHLWPYWFHLIEQCRPDTIFGEQVETAIRYGWLDLVCSDLEGIGYAFAPFCLPAAGFGAPHIRQRLWFVAHYNGERQQQITRDGFRSDAEHDTESFCRAGGVANCLGTGSQVGVPRGAHEKGQDQLGHIGRGCTASDARETNGFWQDADWLLCRDGKWRPVEPGTFPLADGVTSRVGRLRAYGNAIVAQVAEEVIRAYIQFERAS